MRVIDPGHVYDLNWLDGKPEDTYYIDDDSECTEQEPHSENRLIFVKREGEKYPGNANHHPGTTSQEVLRALIARIKYVDAQQHHSYNELVLHCMREAIEWLEARAAQLVNRDFFVRMEMSRLGVFIEDLPVCTVCHHILLEGAPHQHGAVKVEVV